MAVITISRQFGAGGLTLGPLVAQRLNYTFFDQEIIQMVAEKAKVSQEFVESIEKEAGGTFSRLINSVVPKSVVERVISSERGYIDEEIYVDLLRKIVVKIAEGGNTVILGRGGQYILKGREQVYHVLLVADKEHRIKFIEKKYKLSPKQSLELVSTQDKRRINLYRKFHQVDYDQPVHYHLVLNMGMLSMEKGVELVCRLLDP